MNASGYWRKGQPKPPDHGQPFRHVRQKIALLVPSLDAGELEAVLLKIAEKRPEAVLEAVCDVMDGAWQAQKAKHREEAKE